MIIFLFVLNILFNTVYGTNHVKETQFVGFRKHFGGSMTSVETIFNFCSLGMKPIVCQVLAYGRSKIVNKHLKEWSLERWSLTRGSIYSD